MSMPTVSVVIPTYNRCAEVTEAVQSVLAQDPPPLEVLVCDDGSTDGTREAFERWEQDDGRVRYLRLPRNTGRPAGPRNAGLDAARGDWVAFLDSDDRWRPGKLARQVPWVVAGKHDVVASDAVRADGSRYFGPTGGHREPGRGEILRHNPFVLSTAIVRRALLVRAGGFETARWASGVEDYSLWLKLSDLGARFVRLDEPLVDYDDAGVERLSERIVPMQRAVTRLSWGRWMRHPSDVGQLVAALRHTHAIRLAAQEARRRGGVVDPAAARSRARLVDTPAMNLLDQRSDVHSQNGEDGVIAAIFERIGPTSQWCCEFGAWDGFHFSNTRRLIDEGWHALLIEADAARYKELVANNAGNDRVRPLNAMVDASLLNELLDYLPPLDLLSVDIDGLDYDVLAGLTNTPRVICVEVNAGHPPETSALLPASVAGDNVGQPFGAFHQLLSGRGYQLVAFTGNAFYVRREDATGLPDLTPAVAYQQFVAALSLEEKRWLFHVNRGDVAPFHRFRNPRLTRRALGLGHYTGAGRRLRSAAERALGRRG